MPTKSMLLKEVFVLLASLSVVGSLLIVVGLYSVLWGKTKEVKLQQHIEMTAAAEAKLDDYNNKEDLEEQSYVVSNANIPHK